MEKKKIIILAICVVVVILAICGIVGIVKIGRNNEDFSNTNQDAYVDRSEVQRTNENRVLVIYFSWGGHTEQLANEIASKTGGESVIIDVKKEYPINYEECASVAQAQKDENARPELKDLGVNIADYGKIFVGYPIWFEDMPMPIYTLLENNDFSGKTVIPFTTSGSSGESGTFEKIKGILSSSTVLDGIHISEESINNNTFKEELDAWVDSLQLGI